MEYKLKVYSIWHTGKRVDAEGNPHQEDRLFPAYGKATDKDRLFILCDGMGGHDAGEIASATVCEAMSKSILSAINDVEGDFSEEILKKAITDAFDALDAMDDGLSEKKMGTTMTFLKLYNKGCYIAHIGDSRVYHIRPGKTIKDTQIIFHTEDHSLVNELVKAGELTQEEARHSKQKNVITRAMQPHMERRPNADIYHTIDIAPDDYFYLCSDGMLENMEDYQLCYFFSDEAGDDNTKVTSLLKATEQNKDNHSAIIIHVLEVQNPIPYEPKDISCITIPNSSIGDIPIKKRNKNKSKSFLLVILAAVIFCLALILFLWQPKHDIKQPVTTKEKQRSYESVRKPIKKSMESPKRNSSSSTTKPKIKPIANPMQEIETLKESEEPIQAIKESQDEQQKNIESDIQNEEDFEKNDFIIPQEQGDAQPAEQTE